MNTFHFSSLKRSLPEGERNNPSLPSRGTLGALRSAVTKLFCAQMKTAGLEQDLGGNISWSYPHNNPKREFPQKTAVSTFIKMVMNSTQQQSWTEHTSKSRKGNGGAGSLNFQPPNLEIGRRKLSINMNCVICNKVKQLVLEPRRLQDLGK